MEKCVLVMIEKTPGIFLVEKLGGTLFLEAVFNVHHKINFNSRPMLSIQSSSSIPHEITGDRRSQTATHLALSKKLIENILNTKKLSTDTTCSDASNCY